MTSRVRQRSAEETLEAAHSLRKRISRALNSFDAGEFDALQDVAAHTRTALTYGNGDKVVHRLVNMHGLDEPTVFLPPVGILWGAVEMQVGPIPCEETANESREVPVSQWISKELAATLPGFGRQTWDRFITTYANGTGAHVSTTVRAELEHIQLFQGPTMNVADYMLRAAGVVAERSLTEVLQQIDGAHEHDPRMFYPGGVRLGAITQNSRGEVGWDISVDLAKDAPIALIPASGHSIKLHWVWDAKTETGGLRVEHIPDPT